MPIQYKKLKETLSGPALALISRYPSKKNNLYQTALNDLTQTYEDHIHFAGF